MSHGVRLGFHLGELDGPLPGLLVRRGPLSVAAPYELSEAICPARPFLVYGVYALDDLGPKTLGPVPCLRGGHLRGSRDLDAPLASVPASVREILRHDARRLDPQEEAPKGRINNFIGLGGGR